MSLILFIFAALAVIAFVVFKILDPSSEATERKHELGAVFGTEGDQKFTNLLLRLGPVIFGFGFIGWLIQKTWDNPGQRLLILTVITLLCTGAGYLCFYLSKNGDKNKFQLYKLLTESLFLFATFLIGGMIFAINGYSNSIGRGLPFGSTESLGIWTVLVFPFVYLTRSYWLLAIHGAINFFFLIQYISQNVNIISILGFPLQSRVNDYLVLILPSITVVMYTLVYAWHQSEKHNNSTSPWRPFYYITGLNAFFAGGSLVMAGIFGNFSFIKEAGLVPNLFLVAVAIIPFLIDFVSKSTFKKYNVNILAGAMFLVTGIFSIIFINAKTTFSTNLFLPFLFVEIPFVIWLLADYLRQKSPLSQILFYVFNGLQFFLIASSGINDDWFKLIILTIVLMYASFVHNTNKPFLYYVGISSILAIIFKFISNLGASALSFDFFQLFMVGGGLVMLYGFFLTFLKNKNVQIQKETKNN